MTWAGKVSSCLKLIHVCLLRNANSTIIIGDPQKHPLLILGPALSWYLNAIVGTILQTPRFATLRA